VLEHQDAVGGRDGDRSARSALADDDGDDRNADPDAAAGNEGCGERRSRVPGARITGASALMRRLELMDLPLSVGEKHAATGSGASARLAPGR